MRMQNAPQLTLYIAPLSTFQESFSTPQGHPTCTRVSSVNFKIQCSLLYLLLHSSMALDQHIFPPPPQYHVTRPTHSPGNLGHTGFIYIRHGAHRNPLQRPYASPFPVLERNEKYLSLIMMAKERKSQLTASKLLTHLPWIPCSVQLQHSNYQFLHYVDHSLGHHSQILQFLSSFTKRMRDPPTRQIEFVNK